VQAAIAASTIIITKEKRASITKHSCSYNE
jgi:hypothetical protein